MTGRRFIGKLGMAFAAACLPVCFSSALAADFGSRPITFVVPFAAGSATDQIARLLAQQLSADLKTTVTIDNKAGAGGLIAAKQVANAPADGTTVFITTNTTQAANQYLYKTLPYDPVTDFTPVALLRKTYQAILVRSDLPVKNVADLVELAKRQPKKLTFGSGSSSSRMGIELLRQLAGVDMLHVPYKSNPQVVTALMASEIDVAALETGVLHAQNNKFRAIAVTSQSRLPHLPNLPTVEESGLKGYEMSSWTAVYLPRGAAPELVKQLNQLMVKYMSTPAMEQMLKTSGTVRVTSSAEGLARFQAEESEKWKHVIRQAGIEPE